MSRKKQESPPSTLDRDSTSLNTSKDTSTESASQPEKVDPRDPKEQWDRSRERGSLLGMRILAWFYRRVGWRAAHLLLYPVVAYFFITDRLGRRASIAYLRRIQAAGSNSIPKEPSLRHVFLHYMEFGTTILDRLGFWLARTEDFEFSVDGSEHLDWIVKEGRGAIILGSHLGSFDAMRLVASMESPINIKLLMYTRHAALINQFFHQMGKLAGSDTTIGVIQALPGSFSHTFEVKQAIARGEAVAILADRIHPNERGRDVEVEFLGDRARLPQGPMLLAAALGCPVLMMTGLRAGSRKYKIHVERFGDAINIPRRDRTVHLQKYAQAYANSLAELCKLAPFQWFNFYDFWAKAPKPQPHRYDP